MRELLLILIVAVLLTGQSSGAASYSANHDKAVAYFKSGEEKSVLDASWTGSRYFAVGRYNTGGKQDGFAMYVCVVLDDFGFKGKKISVTVIDIVKLKQTKDWSVIGRANCR